MPPARAPLPAAAAHAHRPRSPIATRGCQSKHGCSSAYASLGVTRTCTHTRLDSRTKRSQAASGGKTGVLFVCLGNICRSPTAEAMFRAVAEREGVADKFDIDSCGTGGGNPGW